MGTLHESLCIFTISYWILLSMRNVSDVTGITTGVSCSRNLRGLKPWFRNPGDGKMWACRVEDKRQDILYCRSKRDKQVRVGNVSDYLPALQKAMSVSITKTNRFMLPGEIIVVYVIITRSTQIHRVVKLHSSPAMQRMEHTQVPT